MGVPIATERVCAGHSAPAEFFAGWILDRPALSLVLGPRGGGKSYLAALATHIESAAVPGHQTKVLGGSEAQSAQIYEALTGFAGPPSVHDLAVVTATRAAYLNGSTVGYIPASAKSVRGPHVHTLRLDEIDEMDPDVRESAFGMCMAARGFPLRASITMTSTWHRVSGPMADLLERGREGAFPVWTFCAFEVLERCPEERSGPGLERCPECPLVAWCHADRDADPLGRPKAKRSHGHYAIESLIQKAKGLSRRVFEADYLCAGPKADGVWFAEFAEPVHVRESVEYDPALPAHLAVDSGVFTAAVLFQVRPVGPGADRRVTVFADYLAEGITAETAAREILALARERCGPTAELRVSTDAAGDARNPVGPTVIAEYERAGLRGARGIERWPKFGGSVTDGLQLVEALLRSADGSVSLTIHPRCRRLVDALKGYARAKRAGQWMDYPADPQHPHEDLIDALRGGLKTALPESRRPPPALKKYAGRLAI